MYGLREIQRALIIIRKVKLSNGITLKGLKEKITEELSAHGYEKTTVSDRTLQRDIQNLHRLRIHIEYSRTRGYHFPDARDEEEDPENAERVLEAFGILNALAADTGMNRFVFPTQRPYEGRKFLYDLLEITREHIPVIVHYKKFGKEETLERYVFPYALKEWRSRWYLLGMVKGEEKLTTFGLDRIVRIKRQSGHFTPEDMDINALYRDCYGIYNDQSIPPEEVILSYDKQEGEYVRTQPIHHSQEILPDTKNQGRLFIKLKVRITKEFQLEILARGFSLQVHKPESLRKAIHEVYRNGMKANEPGIPLLF